MSIHNCPACEQPRFTTRHLAGLSVPCPRHRGEARLAPRRLRSLVHVLVLGLVAVGLSGAAWQWRQSRLPVQEPLERTLAAKGGVSEVQVPARWTQRHIETGDQAVLMAGSRGDDMCVRVVSDHRASFRPSMTLDQYGRMSLDQMKERLLGFEVVSGPAPALVGGQKALRWEVRGTATSAGVKAVFLHTVVEGRRHFHQVIALSLASGIERNRGQLKAIADSFREVR